MKFTLAIELAALCLMAQSCVLPVAPVPNANQLHLVWNDEFMGNELDASKWMTRQKDLMHGKSLILESCTTLNGKGHAVLMTRLTNDAGSEIESGMIATQGIQEWQYGLFEARVQFESAPGHHGAFWLQSRDYGIVKDDLTASGAELDVIEYFGRHDSLSHNIHWNAYGSSDKQHIGSGSFALPDSAGHPDEGFYVYSMHWTPEEYVFYTDGIETWRTTTAVSHHPGYIILSVLASKWEAKHIDPALFPDSMVVDWVRVYQ